MSKKPEQIKAEMNKPVPAAEMSFMGHIEALRWHLIRSVIVIISVAGVAFCYKEFIFDTLILGPKNPDFWTYQTMCNLAQRYNLGDQWCITSIGFKIMNTEMAGQFNTHIFISVMAGIIVGFPYLAWELWRFVKPALHTKEKKGFSGVVFFSSLLFIMGVLFGYYIIVPMSVNFLGTYTISAEILNQVSLDSYISTVATLTLGAGAVFELPVVIYFMSKMGIMTPSFMRTYQRYAVVIILLIAAIITPTPDIPTQMMVAFPLFILYEISIFISGMVERKRKKAEIEFYND